MAERRFQLLAFVRHAFCNADKVNHNMIELALLRQLG
jgi:hypothetical protein